MLQFLPCTTGSTDTEIEIQSCQQGFTRSTVVINDSAGSMREESSGSIAMGAPRASLILRWGGGVVEENRVADQ